VGGAILGSTALARRSIEEATPVPEPAERYRAFVARGDGRRPFGSVETLSFADLPRHPVAVRVEASSLNYKDALSAAGRPGVTRTYPFVPGIDAAGVVVASEDPRWRAGDRVIVTSYDLGMNTPGGFGEYVRVPGEWPVAMPPSWDARTAMGYGTAGLTAALAVAALEGAGVVPSGGPVAVTGASGGVGTLSVALLAAAGYEVVAVTGRAAAEERLLALGAREVWGREALEVGADRPLLRPDLAGAVDAVGGAPLAQLLKRVAAGGAVAAAGNVAGGELVTTVYPFILRGVSLLGIDSATCPRPLREAAWARLARSGLDEALDRSLRDVDLEALEAPLAALLEGGVDGRVRLVHRRWSEGLAT
jgi:acrylyl-CoA reductase (NADPH)